MCDSKHITSDMKSPGMKSFVQILGNKYSEHWKYFCSLNIVLTSESIYFTFNSYSDRTIFVTQFSAHMRLADSHTKYSGIKKMINWINRVNNAFISEIVKYIMHSLNQNAFLWNFSDKFSETFYVFIYNHQDFSFLFWFWKKLFLSCIFYA